MPKYAEEKTTILKSIDRCRSDKSNLLKFIEQAILLSRELATVWTSSTITEKENLQKLVFPEGAYYNFEKQEYRTGKINAAFSLFASLNAILSSREDRTMFEPVYR